MYWKWPCSAKLLVHECCRCTAWLYWGQKQHLSLVPVLLSPSLCSCFTPWWGESTPLPSGELEMIVAQGNESPLYKTALVLLVLERQYKALETGQNPAKALLFAAVVFAQAEISEIRSFLANPLCCHSLSAAEAQIGSRSSDNFYWQGFFFTKGWSFSLGRSTGSLFLLWESWSPSVTSKPGDFKELRASFTFPWSTLEQFGFFYAHLWNKTPQTLGQEHLKFIRKRWKVVF